MQKRTAVPRDEREKGWRNGEEIVPSRLDRHRGERKSFDRKRQAKRSKYTRVIYDTINDAISSIIPIWSAISMQKPRVEVISKNVVIFVVSFFFHFSMENTL